MEAPTSQVSKPLPRDGTFAATLFGFSNMGGEAGPLQAQKGSEELVNPVVRVRGRLIAMIADVHFKLLLQPPAFPIGKIVPVVVEERSAPQVDVAD